jgi:abhydrolase domain-containing protein 12
LALAPILYRTGRPPVALFLIAPYTSIFNLLTSYKIGGLLPIFWPIGLWKVLSDLAERHLYTRFESDKALYQIVKGGPSHLDASEIDQYGNLDYQLSTATLMQELAVISPHSSLLPPNIIISHADDDAVIPHSHGRSLLDTIALALGESKENQIDTIEQPWGHTLTLQDASHNRTFVLVKSRKGGHNGVPQHTVEIFRTIVGLKK